MSMGKSYSKGEIFDAFVAANTRINGLTVKPDSIDGEPVYSGMGFNGSTVDDIMGTRAYAGFVDGYENNPMHGQGPTGSSKQKTPKSFNVIESALSNLAYRQGTDSDLTPAVTEMAARVLDTVKLNGQKGYDEQFLLGSGQRGVVIPTDEYPLQVSGADVTNEPTSLDLGAETCLRLIRPDE